MINFVPPTVAAGRVPAFSLVVDLAAEPLGPRWSRGAATLALLCASVIALAPGFGLLTAHDVNIAPPSQQFRLNRMLTGAPGAPKPAR